jgi:hypothetical protein
MDRTNWSNTVISYYPFGGAIALALDLTLRDRSDSRVSLDDFMRAMWRSYGKPGGSREGYVDRPTRSPTPRRRSRRSAATRRSPASSSRATSRATTSPTTAAAVACRLHGAQAQRRPRVARRSAPRDARRRARRRARGADLADLRLGLDQDDELQQIDGQRINNDGDVAAALARRKPGDTIQIAFVDRTGSARTARVTLAEDPHMEVVPAEHAGTLTAAQKSVSRSLAGSEVMPLPWLQIIDAVVGVTNFARSRRAGVATDEQQQQQMETAARTPGGLEARMAGVVVAALKEAFDRDTRRLELERDQLAAERERAERAMRLELQRQAADREIGRLRLLAGVAIAGMAGHDAARDLAGQPHGGDHRHPRRARRRMAAPRAALAASFSAQARVAAVLDSLAAGGGDSRGVAMSGPAGAAALWLDRRRPDRSSGWRR